MDHVFNLLNLLNGGLHSLLTEQRCISFEAKHHKSNKESVKCTCEALALEGRKAGLVAEVLFHWCGSGLAGQDGGRLSGLIHSDAGQLLAAS